MVDNNSLDTAFKNAFADTELLPSPEVWANIAKAMVVPQRRKVPIYLKIAAVALLFSGAAVYFNQSHIPPIQNQNPSPLPKDSSQVIIVESPSEKSDSITTLPSADLPSKSKQESKHVVLGPGRQSRGNKEQLPSLHAITVLSDTNSPKLAQVIDEIALTEFEFKGKHWNLIREQQDHRLSMVPFWQKKSENHFSRYWVGAGFGGGNSSLASNSRQEDALSSPAFDMGSEMFVVNTTTNLAGTSFSSGLSMGMNIGRKLLIESGLTFMTTQLRATSNTVESFENSFFPVYYKLKFGGELVRVSEYTFSNTLNYISVPVKIGYKIVDRRIGWIVNTGLASNFLLNQRIQSSQFGSFKTSADDSFFRGYTLNTLLGTEVYIRIGKHYTAGLLTNYTFSLMDATKPDAPFAIRPSQLQFGFNLRYLLK